MKLYSFPGSPNCSKVLVCARELRLELQVENLSLEALKKPSYRDVHPLGMVPALQDGPLTLWESGAILAHLAGKASEPSLLPAEAAPRADTLRWLLFYSSHVHPAVYLLGWEQAIKEMVTGVAGADPHRVAFAREQLERCLPVIEAQLETREYLTGKYSISDIAAGVSLLTLRDFIRHDLGAYPAVARWLDRLQRREAWKAVLTR